MQGKSIQELEQLANGGNADATQELGLRYYKGIGTGVDYAKAKGYFEKADKAGCKASSYYLGMIYYNGNGTAIDHNKARQYFEKSDKDNNIFSSYYLGKIYYWGDGVQKNPAKAYEYKSKVMSTPFFASQKAGDVEFYSLTDIEQSSRDYANAVQQKVQNEFQKLYGINDNSNKESLK